MEKIAIFGYNNIAQKHLTGLRAILTGEINNRIVVAGRHTEKAREMTEKYGRFLIYDNWQELLDKEKPELVIVATPNFLHKEMTIAALQAGSHVLCEKPLGINSGEVEEMFQSARDANRFLIPAMSTRYSENALWLKTQLDSLGSLPFNKGEAKYLRARHIPGAVGFLKKNQAGGGALLDLGVHVLDLALWLWKEDVIAVRGHIKTDVTELAEEARIANDYGQTIDLTDMDVEYEAEADLTFKNGGMLNIHVSWASLHQDAIRGDKADEKAPFIRLATQDGQTAEWSLKKATFRLLENISHEPLQNRYTRQLEYVASLIAEKRQKPLIAEAEMIRLHQVIDAIYLSATRNGQTVNLT